MGNYLVVPFSGSNDYSVRFNTGLYIGNLTYNQKPIHITQNITTGLFRVGLRYDGSTALLVFTTNSFTSNGKIFVDAEDGVFYNWDSYFIRRGSTDWYWCESPSNSILTPITYVLEPYTGQYEAVSDMCTEPIITYPITYSYTNSTVSGPSEAAVGDTVTVSAVPNAGYGITDASTQILVTNDDVAVPYTWDAQTNQITFTMPQPATNRGGFGSTGQ